MNLLDAIFLSFLQGVAEFLPISSSGHLFLMKYLLNISDIPVTFDIILHFASLLAIITVYFNDLIRILLDSYDYIFLKSNDSQKKYNLRVFIGLIISTSITVIVYLFFKLLNIDEINDIKIVGTFFIITALMLIVSRFIKHSTEKITFFSIICSGVFQGIGVLPGISRSGASIFGSLICKVSLQESARYSFLLAIPAILGAFVLDIKNMASLDIKLHIILISFIVCYFISLFSMKFLIKLVSKGSYYLFSPYLILIGVSCFFLHPI